MDFKPTAVMQAFRQREMQEKERWRERWIQCRVYSVLALRGNGRNRNRWNVWLLYIKMRVGVAGMLLQHCACNAAWRLPELNSKLGRRGGRREESRGEKLRRGEGEKMRESASVTEVKNKLMGWKECLNVNDGLLFKAEQRNDSFPPI